MSWPKLRKPTLYHVPVTRTHHRSTAPTSARSRRALFSSRGSDQRDLVLEQAFVGACDRDASVDAFCKVSEQKHTFARLRYTQEGLNVCRQPGRGQPGL